MKKLSKKKLSGLQALRTRVKKIHVKHVKEIVAKKNLKWAAPLAVVLVVGSVVLFGGKDNLPAGQKTQAEAYQEVLRDQVDDKTGAPRDGRDPANQQQGSLAAAASQPTGAGKRTDNTPASGVGDGNGGSPAPGSNAEQTGLNSAGCYYEYGNGGQCVAAHAATNGVLTCEGVRTHGGFPNGVTYTKDRFNLDKNHDGIACNPGE